MFIVFIAFTFSDFLQDAKSLYSSPFYWNKKELFLATSSCVTTFSLMFVDKNIREFVSQYHNPTFFKIDSLFPKKIGIDGVIIGIPVFTVTSLGLLTKDENLKRLTDAMIESMIFAELTTYFFKILFGRSRPYTGRGAFNFSPFSFGEGKNSLPSGYTSLAFTVATTISEFSKEKWKDFLAYSMAVSVAFMRIYKDKHWFSDTFAGAIIGIYIAKKIANFKLKKEGKRKKC